MRRGIIAGFAGAVLLSGLGLVSTAGASTAACADGDGGFCGSQTATQLAAPLSLAVPNANPAVGSGLATAIPGLNRRTDFDMRQPATGEEGSGGPAKIFRWSPRGINSNLCITGHETAKSAVTLQRCRGINRQKWVPQFPDGSTVVWVNLGTGLAMRIDTTSGAVLNKDPGLGTGLNERFAFTSGAPPPVTLTAHHKRTNGPPNNPFNIWEKFGSSYAVGNTDLVPGTPAIAVEHPGRTLHWFPTSGTYMGNQNGNITFSGGLLLASTNDCSNATLKSDPAALGTVWEIKVEGGDFVVINRRCDQAAGSPNMWGLALTGSTHVGDPWKISNVSFRAVLLPAA